MKLVWMGALALGGALSLGGIARAERPIMLDKIVAVVDGAIIYRSDVVARARPHLQRVKGPDGKPVGAQPVYKGMLERMIDEKLFLAEMEKAHVGCEPAEIEQGIDTVAKMANMSREALEKEVVKNGLTMEEYRDEIRRQVIEGKWMQLRIRYRVRVDLPPGTSDAEREKAYAEATERERKAGLKELRSKAHVEVRW